MDLLYLLRTTNNYFEMLFLVLKCFHRMGYYFHKINFLAQGVTHFVINDCINFVDKGLLVL